MGCRRVGQLLTIGDPFKETVRLRLSTLNAAKVELNMPVEVSLIGPESQVCLRGEFLGCRRRWFRVLKGVAGTRRGSVEAGGDFGCAK